MLWESLRRSAEAERNVCVYMLVIVMYIRMHPSLLGFLSSAIAGSSTTKDSMQI
jgi:hypothetical protein